MKKQGINLESVKASNRGAILRLLNNKGSMSRKDIAKAVGLTPASVTMLCQELMEEGIIHELGEADEGKRVGRKKILVDINSTYKYVLCACIESEETYISITDLKGNIISTSTISTDKEMPSEEFIISISLEFKKLMWNEDLRRDQILGVGVSVPGKVNAAVGLSVNSYSIWTTPVDIKGILERELEIPVLLENNVKAFARSEIIFGEGRDNENLLILKWGPGVGAAIIADNKIYQGANGVAAEVGHIIGSNGGKLCSCGRRGCLETEVSTHGIIESIMEAYGDAEDSHKAMPVLDQWIKEGNSLTYKNTAEWGSLEDEKLQEIFSNKIERMVITAVNIVQMLDPSRIVLIGYLFDVPTFFDRFKEGYEAIDTNCKNSDFIVKANSRLQLHTETLAMVLDNMFF